MVENAYQTGIEREYRGLIFLLHVVCEDKSLAVAGTIAITIIIAIAVIIFETKLNARLQWNICILDAIVVIIVVIVGR